MTKKIAVLAYSGGLDSTISIDWIRKNYGYDVINHTEDLGGGQFSTDLEKRAKKAGAIDCVILDVKKENNIVVHDVDQLPKDLASELVASVNLERRHLILSLIHI